jgi:hypothetical protein
MSANEFHRKYIAPFEEAFLNDDENNDIVLDSFKAQNGCTCLEGARCLWCKVRCDPDLYCNLGSKDLRFIPGRIIFWNMTYHRNIDRWKNLT